jgi:hypothetical protein
MKLFVKTAIAILALASMLQAETTLLGVDGGVTVLGLRIGANAGLTVGTKPLSTPAAGSKTATVSCAATYTSPCSYVCEPCEVIAPPVCPCK